MEGATEVVKTVQGVGKGGHGWMYLGNNLCGSGPGGPAVWVVDMCYDTTHGEGVVWIPPQGIPQYDGTETSEGGGYPPLEEVMEEAGLQEVDTYVSHLHNTVTQFIIPRIIMDLCLAAESRPV